MAKPKDPDNMLIDMNSMLHDKVKMKNGVEGTIIGFYKKTGEKFNFLVEYWNENGKISGWYYSEDFEVVDA